MGGRVRAFRGWCSSSTAAIRALTGWGTGGSEASDDPGVPSAARRRAFRGWCTGGNPVARALQGWGMGRGAPSVSIPGADGPFLADGQDVWTIVAGTDLAFTAFGGVPELLKAVE